MQAPSRHPSLPRLLTVADAEAHAARQIVVLGHTARAQDVVVAVKDRGGRDERNGDQRRPARRHPQQVHRRRDVDGLELLVRVHPVHLSRRRPHAKKRAQRRTTAGRQVPESSLMWSGRWRRTHQSAVVVDRLDGCCKPGKIGVADAQIRLGQVAEDGLDPRRQRVVPAYGVAPGAARNTQPC